MSKYFYIGLGGDNNFSNIISAIGYSESKEKAEEAIKDCLDGYVIECTDVKSMGKYSEPEVEYEQ